jgi:hypothetical protein
VKADPCACAHRRGYRGHVPRKAVVAASAAATVVATFNRSSAEAVATAYVQRHRSGMDNSSAAQQRRDD